MSERRRLLLRSGLWTAAAWIGAAKPVQATPSPAATSALRPTAIAVPGPGCLPYLPLLLAPKLGADRQEGLALEVRAVGGDPLALHALQAGEVDFAAAGLPSAAVRRAKGKPLQALAPLTQVPAYTLVVQAGLKGRVQKVQDLAGRVIGVEGRTVDGRATSHLLADFLLQQAGVEPKRVRFMAVSENYANQRAMLGSGTVQALMTVEPFAGRLVREGWGFVLQDFHDPASTRAALGGLFTNAVLLTRDEVVAEHPDWCDRLVKTLRRTLAWQARRAPQEVVQTLALADARERDNLLEALKQRRTVFPADVRFSSAQLAAAEALLQAVEPTARRGGLGMGGLVNERWAGRMP